MTILKDPVGFFKSAYNELKLVKWPDRETTIRLTIYVIGASLLVGIYLSGADYLFAQLLREILN